MKYFSNSIEENIALKKPTWQQYPFSSFHSGSDLAVDGRKTNLTYSGGECVLSANFKSTTEWRVDLRKVSLIQYIVIHFRTDGLKWGIASFFKFNIHLWLSAHQIYTVHWVYD